MDMFVCSHKHEYVLNSYVVCCRVYSEIAWIPNGFVFVLVVQGKDPYSRIVLDTKGDSTRFFLKRRSSVDLLSDVSLYAGHDSSGVVIISH